MQILLARSARAAKMVQHLGTVCNLIVAIYHIRGKRTTNLVTYRPVQHLILHRNAIPEAVSFKQRVVASKQVVLK